MPIVQFQDDNNTSINFDKNPSQQDIEEAYSKINGQQQSNDSDAISDGVQTNFAGNPDSTPSVEQPQVPQGTQSTPNQNPQKNSFGDQAIRDVGQFGKGIYNNPIVHPALKALSDITGSNADELYGALGQPQNIQENISSGIGQALPMVAATSPMFKAVGATLDAGAASGLPVISKLAGIFKDSTIAKSAITGYGYGLSEATAMNMQGNNVDAGKYAKDTAMSFAMWGALTRGGATLGAKFLPVNLPKTPQAINDFVSKNLPLVNDAVKKFYTPEGLGSIAGGMAAGAMGAPDVQKGLSGAIIGGAMSGMNPSEKFQFKQGLGKAAGFDFVKSVLKGWGPQYPKSIQVIEDNGMDDVMKTGKVDPQVQQQLGLQPNETTAHVAAKTMLNGVDKFEENLQTQAKPVMQQMENGATKSDDTASLSLVDKITRLINSRVGTPLTNSALKTTWQNALSNLQAVTIPADYAKQNGIAPKDYQGKTWRMPVNDVHNIDDPQVRQDIFRYASGVQVKEMGKSPSIQMDMPPQGGISPEKTRGLTNVSIESLDNARQAMRRVAYSGNGDAQEQATAKQIYGMISGHLKSIGSKSGTVTPYTKLMNDYSDLYNLKDKVGDDNYRTLAVKLADPHWASQDPNKAINTENNLKEIDQSLEKHGLSNYKTKDLLDKYHAYRVFADPTMESFAKNYLARHVISTLSTAALATMTGGGNPIAGLVGGVAGYQMGNPEAWIPVLRGASISKHGHP